MVKSHGKKIINDFFKDCQFLSNRLCRQQVWLQLERVDRVHRVFEDHRHRERQVKNLHPGAH